MAKNAAKMPDMGRPPADKPKSEILHIRVHPEVKRAVERFAREEKRTVASMADLMVREAIITRLKENGEDTKAIEELP